MSKRIEKLEELSKAMKEAKDKLDTALHIVYASPDLFPSDFADYFHERLEEIKSMLDELLEDARIEVEAV